MSASDSVWTVTTQRNEDFAIELHTVNAICIHCAGSN